MFSTPEVQRLVSGDNAEIDLDDLKYVTFQTPLMSRRTKIFFTRFATTAVILPNTMTDIFLHLHSCVQRCSS